MAKKRLSDKEFWGTLRANAGLYSRTARAIEKAFNTQYTRQAVKDRAEKRPDLLADILEENLDIAEEGQHSLMRSKNERIKQRAIEFYLKTKGKARGYIERSEVTGEGGKDLIPQKSIEEKKAELAGLLAKING